MSVSNPSLARSAFLAALGFWFVVAACSTGGRSTTLAGSDPNLAVEADRSDETLRLAYLAQVDSVRVLAATVASANGAAPAREAALARLIAGEPDESWINDDVRELARDLFGDLSAETGERLLAGVAAGHPLLSTLQAAQARSLVIQGEFDEAATMAQAALEARAAGADRDIAQAIVAGAPVPGLPVARLGLLLPLSGSPSLQRFSEGVREGVEAAVHASSLGDDGVVLEVADDGGDAELSRSLMRMLESEGALAVVGPLDVVSLNAALQGRSRGLPLVSPTVWSLPANEAAVLSLGADDRQGAALLASWAASVGLDSVIVLAPSEGPGSLEAGFFAEAFVPAGGTVLRRLTYEPGTAFFREQMETIRALQPAAVVLPIPASDVPALASQAAFFALDTLGIQLLGTAGWADPVVLAEVSTRFTDGVVVAAPVQPADDAGYQQFRQAYEARFQRTLVDAGPAALGYDAASLILRALERGVRTPAAVAKALETGIEFEGATGIWSVDQDRATRSHEIVCMAAAQRLVMEPGERPVPIYRPYEPDPETDSIPEGPGHMMGLVCPSLAQPDTLAATDTLPTF